MSKVKVCHANANTDITTVFPSHLLLYHITIIEKMVSGKEGMNAVTMNIKNHLKKIGQAEN